MVFFHWKRPIKCAQRLPELYCYKTHGHILKPEDVLAVIPRMKPNPGPHQYCSAIINNVRDDQPVKG